MGDSTAPHQPEQQIKIASIEGLTVELVPASIKAYILTEERLEIVSSLSVTNTVYLAAVGISIGLFASFLIVVKTVELDVGNRALFWSLTIATGLLSAVFGILFGLGFKRSRDLLNQIKQKPIIRQLSQ